MTTITNYGDAEPTDAEQRIAELEQEIAQSEQTTAAYAREAASLRAAVDTYAADLARVSAERDQLREALQRMTIRYKAMKSAADASALHMGEAWADLENARAENQHLRSFER